MSRVSRRNRVRRIGRVRRTSRMTPVLTVLVLGSFALAPAAADGQVRGPGGDVDREELVRRIQRGFEDRLARDLGLDDQQRVALREVFLEFGDDRGDLARRRRALGLEIRGFMTRDIEDMSGAPEERALELIEELRAIRAQEESIIRAEEDRLLEVLRPVQLLRLQLVREMFGDEIRRLDPDPPFGR